MIGPMFDPWGSYHFILPDAEPAYSYLRHIEQGYACTRIVEEQRMCLVCGYPTLIRSHFTVTTDEGLVAEFGYADRCQTCEPYESHMPSIVAGIAMRARSVI
jgi:hypothetical protein